jgi:hypothetical protein
MQPATAGSGAGMPPEFRRAVNRDFNDGSAAREAGFAHTRLHLSKRTLSPQPIFPVLAKKVSMIFGE